MNFKDNLKIYLKSHNGAVSFNIQLKVDKAEEDSSNLFELKMKGSDPEGNSTIEGFASFKDEKMEIALAMTHEKHQRKESSPVYYFEGKQGSEEGLTVEGEWWVEGQRGTTA